MDEIDRELINLLEKDARQSGETLARKLHLSPTTVKRRIRTLVKNKIMRIVALVDPAKLGSPLITGFSINVNNENMNAAVEKLINDPRIKVVSTSTGQWNLLALATFGSTNDLSNFMETVIVSIKGIRSIESYICLELVKGRFMPI